MAYAVTTTVAVRFPPELLGQACRAADADDRSLSAWIRRAVQHELRRTADPAPLQHAAFSQVNARNCGRRMERDPYQRQTLDVYCYRWHRGDSMHSQIHP